MQKITFLIVVGVLVSTLSSCALFRKKNRCADCPSWSKVENKKMNEKHKEVI